jgi:DMSO/TMAO reductase YedYZ molybdopterin-dependent catalytic subunit
MSSTPAQPDDARAAMAARPPVDGRLAALAGILAVGAALAAGELVAGLVAGVPSPLVAIAQAIVDYQPPGAKDFVVGLFGTNDKLALQVFVVLVALAVGAVLGDQARRRGEGLGTTVIAVFAAVGLLASMRDPTAIVVFVALGAAVETLVGSWVLGWLLSAAGARPGRARGAAPAHPSAGIGAASGAGGGPARGPAANGRGKRAKVARTTPARGGMPDWTRRSLLIRGAGVAVGSVAAAAIGRSLVNRAHAPAPAGSLPEPAQAAALPAGASIATADLTSEGLTPIVVPNDDFYRIDTALLPPSVDLKSWTLRIHGMVDHETVLTYDQLTSLPIIEQFVTIACVSNEVGGNLVGNAAWRGVELRRVLAMAGVQQGATQLVGRSVDGFTVGMPVEWVMDQSRTPMIAVGMNGQPLPQLHGFPARLIVPGLYGYVSATKWLSELELTTFEAFDAYWVNLGWAQKAPILTQSRIDVPHDGTTVKAGQQPIAGVAWAPDRGISLVEVAVDGGPWQPAQLSAAISKATWVQWLLPWNATAGSHTIEVRATDGTGAVQAVNVTDPFPDGARGHHRITVRVG